MIVEICLSALPEDDLSWKEEQKIASRAIHEGNKILWNIDLGIHPVLEPLTDEASFQQKAFALTTFAKNIFPAFAEGSVGVIFASSELYRTISPHDEWEADYEEIEEPFRSRLKSMTVFADYMHRIASYLPDELPAIVRMNAQAATHLADVAFLLSKERFRHLSLEISGWFPNEGSVGCVIPEDAYYNLEINRGLEEIFAWLKEENIEFRLVPEALLNEEWNGLNTLVMLASAVSASGKRKARGFMAAGGSVISYGGEIGIDGEDVVWERNRSRGIRTPDLLLPKQPR